MRRNTRRKRNRNAGKVELNMAAMLDMAFQLLAFFILTFHPSDVEAQISMLMPPPKPIPGAAGTSKNELPVEDSTGFPIEITCVASSTGEIEKLQIAGHSMAIGTTEQTLASFSDRAQAIFDTPGNDSAQIHVDPKLRYDILIKLLDTCTNRKLPNGERLTRIGITQLKSATAQ